MVFDLILEVPHLLSFLLYPLNPDESIHLSLFAFAISLLSPSSVYLFSDSLLRASFFHPPSSSPERLQILTSLPVPRFTLEDLSRHNI